MGKEEEEEEDEAMMILVKWKFFFPSVSFHGINTTTTRR